MCELRVCELQVFASWKFASGIIWKKELPMQDASGTYFSGVKYWHVESLGVILSKAVDNKDTDMCTFLFTYVIS